MATTYYHTVDGEIQGETTNGVRTDYLTDALGSVVATVNSSAAVVNTYRYKPYGGLLAKTGTGDDPRFGWTGDTGSRRNSRAFSDQYNLARHCASDLGRWTSVDPLWPSEPSYGYCSSNPVLWTDPTGEQSQWLWLGLCAGCCCHVDLARQFWSTEETRYEWGHNLRTIVQLTNRLKLPQDKDGSCSLKWFEKANGPLLGGNEIGSWEDVCTKREKGAVSCPEDNFHPPTDCPGGPVTFRDMDSPGLLKLNQRKATRMLCIKVVITDGCSGRLIVLRWNQLLEVKNGKLIKSVPPGRSQELEDYCNK